MSRSFTPRGRVLSFMSVQSGIWRSISYFILKTLKPKKIVYTYCMHIVDYNGTTH
jgi:hypothetical protein